MTQATENEEEKLQKRVDSIAAEYLRHKTKIQASGRRSREKKKKQNSDSDSTSPKFTYQPKLGDILLFPSSLHHRTIPFTTQSDRIIISFDLLPDTNNYKPIGIGN